MRSGVFMAASPLQLLNAAEARAHFGIATGDAHLVLFPYLYHAENAALLRRLVDGAEWGGVHEVMPVGPAAEAGDGRSWAAVRRSWRRLRELDALARAVGRVDGVFLGNVRNQYMRHLAHRLPHGQTVMMDDGMSTLAIVRGRREAAGRSARTPRPAGMRRRLETLLGGRFGEPGPLTLFTVYQVEPAPGDTVVNHAYARLRGRVAAGRCTADVYFLGSPFPELGMYPLDVYVALLSRVAARFEGRTLWYMPHRAEGEATLREIERRTPFRVQRPEFPIEWELVRAGERPATLAGWYSSALENCHQLFGPSLEIVSFRLPEPADAAVRAAHWDDIQGAYAYLESRGSSTFRVEPLDGAPAAHGVV